MVGTFGDVLVAILGSVIAATFAAILAFFGTAWICASAFDGEAKQVALILAPLAAVISGVVVLVYVYRKIYRYGSE